tara:strand:+ start:2302 stop:2529 length:228 start_codon:yes stop_codon:yes gene_type:complete
MILPSDVSLAPPQAWRSTHRCWLKNAPGKKVRGSSSRLKVSTTRTSPKKRRKSDCSDAARWSKIRAPGLSLRRLA